MRPLDEADTCQAVLLVDVPFCRIGDFSTVCGLKEPAPFAGAIFVNDVNHVMFTLLNSDNLEEMNRYDTYLFSYRHDGGTWAFEVQATSEEDARSRVAKMAYATYDGKLEMKIPAYCAASGALPRLIVAIRNIVPNFSGFTQR